MTRRPCSSRPTFSTSSVASDGPSSGRFISPEELRSLFDEFASTAFRMEALPQVALDYEAELFDQFRAGSLTTTPPEISWWQPWLERVERLSACGRRIQRVRVVDDPLTDYQRFTIWGGAWNERAGERIRYLPRTAARALSVPTDQDWWLFDSGVLVLMHFDRNGLLSARELVTDAERLAAHITWRDLAFAHGTPAGRIAA